MVPLQDAVSLQTQAVAAHESSLALMRDVELRLRDASAEYAGQLEGVRSAIAQAEGAAQLFAQVQAAQQAAL
eukprot:SAG31_NODE_28878_length_404_cov_0.675410_1_plen_71_part_10